MLKKILTVVLLACLVAALFCGCDEQKSITDQEAAFAVLEEMGISMEDTDSLHIHEGAYNGKDVFNVYITVGGHSYTYVVSAADGAILSVTEGAGHAH